MGHSNLGKSFRLLILGSAGALLVLTTPLLAHAGSETGGDAGAAESSVDYQHAGTGTRIFSAGELAIKVLVEASVLGSNEVEVAEISFPPGYEGAGHRHGAIEIFYIVEGVMNHVVNGESHILEPGMIGIVRPADTVTHRIQGDQGVKAVVIWAPGGEVDRLRQAFPEEKVLTSEH